MVPWRAMKENPDFSLESQYAGMIVAGCDEAGRGPLCGPVVAAAVILPDRVMDIPVVIRDSKQMSQTARATAREWICTHADWAVGICSPAEIDELNILWASMRAMERAVSALKTRPDITLVDGNRVPGGFNGCAVVHGDARSLSIAAASIIAKETRDDIMCDLARKYPMYGWEKNAGYPTAAHLAAIEKFGINEHYRRSFGPVKKRIENETAYD